jgi:hypothetical protein
MWMSYTEFKNQVYMIVLYHIYDCDLIYFVKGRSRFVQPGALEAANKKRLRSHDLPQAPPQPTHVTPPPAPVEETYPLTSKVSTLPAIVEVTELPSSQATSHNHSIPFPDSEDDVLDDAPNIAEKKISKYWDLEVISK